jgi:hypothetical protein
MRQKCEIGLHPPIKYLLPVSLRNSVIGILSKKENSAYLHTFSPEDGKSSSLRNFGFSFQYQTVHEVQKPRNIPYVVINDLVSGIRNPVSTSNVDKNTRRFQEDLQNKYFS